MFGPHLIIDGGKCDGAKLADRRVIERILTDYPRAIGMTRIGGPYMFEYQSPDPAYSGVSGLVIIAESHIAIHTFPVLDYFSMDIFSCKEFDHEKAVAYIRDALDVHEMDRTLLWRGLSFRGPHHGPHGATDELIAAAAERNQGLAVTIGSVPPGDPLSPRDPASAGRMVWPMYGTTPDVGTYGSDGAPDGSAHGVSPRVPERVPANAAAAGDRAPEGLIPVQPMLLNPTASVSGLLDRLTLLGGQGRQLGEALARWEATARTLGAPVVLALGPHIMACGLGEVVADLVHRGHASGIIAEGATALADGYESWGYRHYLHADHGESRPAPSPEEWSAGTTALAAMLRPENRPLATHAILAQLGAQLAMTAPHPGLLAAAAHRHVPVFAVGDSLLTQLGVIAVDSGADLATCRSLLAQPGAMVVALGTASHATDFVAAAGPGVPVIAVDAPGFASPASECEVDVCVALPLLAMGLVQRLPQRAMRSGSSVEGAPAASTHEGARV